MPSKSPVGVIASKKTKSQFADALATYTQLTKSEIYDLFPNKSDREQLVLLLKIVNSSAEENEKKALISEKIEDLSGTVIKLVRNFFPGI